MNGLRYLKRLTIEGIFSITKSTSSWVLYLLRLNLIEPWAAVNGTPIARRTWLGSSEPLVQAEPLLAQNPNWSSKGKIASPSINSKLILVVFGKRLILSPLSIAPVQFFRIAFSSLSQSFLIFVFSHPIVTNVNHYFSQTSRFF